MNSYIHEYDTRADQNDLESIPILFRFKERKNEFERDPRHDGAVRTKEDIDLGRLQLLTFDGWIPVTEEVHKAVLETLAEILPEMGG